jgi:transposase
VTVRDLLTRVFPVLERALGYSTRSAPVLVSRYRTPGEVARAGKRGLSEHLHARGAHRPSIPGVVAKALTASEAQTVALRRESTSASLISMPGMGPILGAELLAITARDLTAFGTPARLAAYAGLAPVPHDSGRCTGVPHRTQRYHHRLRHVFHMAALSSLKTDGPYRAFYQRKRSERHRHAKAMIALVRRLVDVLWALLRDNRPGESTAATAPAAT